MRILHVVPLLTPTGAYGGPVTVALNQARALRDRGHEVHIAGAASGYAEEPPAIIDGIPTHLFQARNIVPRSGFAGLFSRGLSRWFAREHNTFDVVHFHLSRSLTTLPLARRAARSSTPYVTQTHGMIDASDKMLAAPLDAIFTRPVMRSAARRFYLTDRERADLRTVVGDAYALHPLPNGVPRAPHFAQPDASGPCEVLFLARLHKRKRPIIFVQAAIQLLADHAGTVFSLVGPDEGEAANVLRALTAVEDDSASRITWEGPLAPDQTLSRMARASVYVLPSIDEPFPMSVLEALSLGIPVVVTDSCGLAGRVRSSGAGIVVDDSVESLRTALDRLLSDDKQRAEMAARARRLAESEFSMEAVARELDAAYRSVLAPRPVPMRPSRTS